MEDRVDGISKGCSLVPWCRITEAYCFDMKSLKEGDMRADVCIKSGLHSCKQIQMEDAANDCRAFSRRAYWAFHEHFPKRAARCVTLHGHAELVKGSAATGTVFVFDVPRMHVIAGIILSGTTYVQPGHEYYPLKETLCTMG
jgi:hypothetical protein